MRNFLPELSLRHSFLCAFATFLVLTSAAVSAGELAGAVDKPRFSEEHAFRAAIDPSDFAKPALTVSNPFGDRSISLNLFAWSTRVEDHRSLVLHLEAGGTSTVTLDSPVSFDRLAVRGDSPFHAEIESLEDGQRQSLQILARDGQGASNKLLGCNGDWTLTCINCSHGPFTAPGFVLGVGDVYWKQNVPTGVAWQTVNHQGITASWQHEMDCPVSVTNSLGDTYSVYVVPLGSPF